MTNHYLTLGVEEFSAIEVVKKQYRKLVKIYHPDKNPNNPFAEDKFKQLAHSYSVLSNPEKKKIHDAWLEGKTYRVKQLSYEERSAIARNKKAAYKRHEIETRYNLYENSFFTIKKRMGTAVFAMSGIFSFFLLNYFQNYEDSSSLIILALNGLLFAVFIYLLIDAYYLKLAFNSVKKHQTTEHAIRHCSYLFIALFFASPILGSLSANLRRVVLLNYKVIEAKPLEINKNNMDLEWTIRFYANYQSYTCRVDGTGLGYYSKNQLVVKYYPGDPRLCKLVKKK